MSDQHAARDPPGRKAPDDCKTSSTTEAETAYGYSIKVIGEIFTKKKREEIRRTWPQSLRRYLPGGNIFQNDTSSQTPHPQRDMWEHLEICQLKALFDVASKARELHFKALPALEDRIDSMPGYSKLDVYQCLNFIREDIPIIIHMKEETLFKLVADTHYRNLFETGTSNGTKCVFARKTWERNMFFRAYSNATAFQRPKYGCLNTTGDIKGCRRARSTYGRYYLVLKPHMRYRCTFYIKDSNKFKSSDGGLGTNEYYAHVLLQYSEQELADLLRVCKEGDSANERKSSVETYKEVQIHGPVCLETDIQALCVPKHENKASLVVSNAVYEFQTKTNCNVLWQKDLLDPYVGTTLYF